MNTRVWVTGLAAAFLAVAPANAGFMAEYSAGHADIGIADDDGAFLHYHFGEEAVINGVPLPTDAEFDPADAYVRIGDAGRVEMPDYDPFIQMLGTPAGAFIWIAPELQDPLLPFLGFATEELDTDSYEGAIFKLVSFSGPGNFALWNSGVFGEPNAAFKTVDGVGSEDMLEIPITHAHYNWGFTQPGVYELTISVQTVDKMPGVNLTDTGVFTFAVGDSTIVPEPSSTMLLGLGALGIGIQRLRRRMTNRTPSRP